jgi:hypothetical protein
MFGSLEIYFQRKLNQTRIAAGLRKTSEISRALSGIGEQFRRHVRRWRLDKPVGLLLGPQEIFDVVFQRIVAGEGCGHKGCASVGAPASAP